MYRDYVKRTGQTPALVLYDVTSSYFEGENNALGEFGYNRDGKKGKKQIVIGLLTAADGEPLSVEVFKGSTGDHCQISPGKFLATTDYAQVSGILLYRQRYTRRALVTGATPAGYLALGSSCTEQAHVRWCGEETNSQCLAYGFDSSDTEFLLPDGSDHWAILVPKDLLFGYLGEESAADLLRNRHVLRCESKLGHQLFGMVGPYYPKVEGAQRRCEQ